MPNNGIQREREINAAICTKATVKDALQKASYTTIKLQAITGMLVNTAPNTLAHAAMLQPLLATVTAYRLTSPSATFYATLSHYATVSHKLV